MSKFVSANRMMNGWIIAAILILALAPTYLSSSSGDEVISTGLYARGVLSFGIIASGVGSVGLIAIGVGSIGIVSIGVASIGIFSFGTCAIGVFAFGILSCGVYAAGLVAVGRAALGWIASGTYAVGVICRARHMISPERQDDAAVSWFSRCVPGFKSAWDSGAVKRWLQSYRRRA